MPKPSPQLENLSSLLSELPEARREEALQIARLYLKYGLPEQLLPRVARDPVLFMEVFLPHMQEDPKTGQRLTPPAIHTELYENARLAILREAEYAPDAQGLAKLGFVCAAPRGSGKSTIISLALVLWATLCRHKSFPVIYSDTSPQAEYIGSNIRRELEENWRIRAYFGDVRGDLYSKKWTQTDLTIVQVDTAGALVWEARVVVRGAGTSTRGLRVKNRRPDLIIGDDLENDDDVQSGELRQKQLAWWNRSILPMVDTRNATILVAGTILHEEAVLNTLLNDPESYITRRWGCFLTDGSSYWPEKFPRAWLEREQRRDPIGFALEYLNDPAKTGIRPIHPESILFYNASMISRDLFGRWTFQADPAERARVLDIYGGCDPAISEAEDACDFACVVIGVTRDRRDVLVLRAVVTKIDFPTQVQVLAETARLFPEHVRFGIESNGYQRSLSQQAKKELRQVIRIREIKGAGGKNAKRLRIMKLAPLIDQRRLWFRAAEADEEGLPDLLNRVRVYEPQYTLYNQVARWPNHRFQDGPDALVMAVEVSGGEPLFAASAPTATADPDGQAA